MNDKELADRVVALGVAARAGDGDSVKVYDSTLNQFYYFTPAQAVHDWRVAGALMEKVPSTNVSMIDGGWIAESEGFGPELNLTIATNESLPRAIIEACVEALR